MVSDDDLPSLSDLLLKRGLYEAFNLAGDASYIKLLFVGPDHQFDAHCCICGKNSTFKENKRPRGSGAGQSYVDEKLYLQDRVIFLEFYCQRVLLHKYVYILQVENETIKKIGQNPSISDIGSAELNKFKSVIEPEYLRELRRAIGLFSHGIGIGSYAYLRRVFEKIVLNEAARARADGEALDGFETSRMEDKIQMLKDRLPAALVKHKSIYSLISSGIHELSEDMCLKHFPIMNAAIVLILEDSLQNKQKKKSEQDLARAIQDSTREVRSATEQRSVSEDEIG